MYLKKSNTDSLKLIYSKILKHQKWLKLKILNANINLRKDWMINHSKSFKEWDNFLKETKIKTQLIEKMFKAVFPSKIKLFLY